MVSKMHNIANTLYVPQKGKRQPNLVKHGIKQFKGLIFNDRNGF